MNVPEMAGAFALDEHGVGGQIKERRRSLLLTQPELASLAGCSERFVRDLEAGKPGVRLDKLQDVLDVLGLELRLAVRKTP
jgi:y4mF family transcriptional regulator